MVEEINLQFYLAILLRGWKYILTLAFLAALAAFITSSLLPSTYQATAVIAITQNQQLIMTSLIAEEMVPRLSALNKTPPPLRAYPSVAVSDEVVLKLLTSLDSPIPNIESVDDLRSHLTAEPGEDLTLLYLSVELESAAQAAHVANLWADIAVTQFNRLYGGLGQQQVAFYEEQLNQIATKLDTTGQAYIEFQEQNNSIILQNQIEALQNAQADLLLRQHKVQLLSGDVIRLRDQLSAQSANAPVTLTEQLLVLGLQSRAFDIENSVSLQVTTDSEIALTSTNRQEQITSLDNLSNTLQAQLTMINTHVTSLEPKIMELQAKKYSVELEEERLNQEQAVVRDAYTALLRQVTEERISAEDTGSGTKLASSAIMPEDPVGPRRLINTITAGMLGLILGVTLFLGIAFWQSKLHNE